MLARVASDLFWMARYIERAENMARILDVGQSLALLSQGSKDDQSVIEALVITGNLDGFIRANRARDSREVAHYLAWDNSNGSSIFNCLSNSRSNARSVRAALTTEMWENLNDTWLQVLQKRHNEKEPVGNAFFEWVKERSHLFRGVTFATARRDQPYQFVQLGTFVERADNTARILSVKQRNAVVVPDDIPFAEYYRLTAVLRSVSAFEAYRDTYQDVIDSRRVAELLITDRLMPRSLRFCLGEIVETLDRLPMSAGKRARRLATMLLAQVEYAEVDEILRDGLDHYLQAFLQQITEVAQAVHESFLEPK